MHEFSGNIHPELHRAFDLPPEKMGKDEFFLRLESAIEDLLQHDFPRLINILYRLDVDEQKLKRELKEHPGENPGRLIANLVIERQLKKIETRKQGLSNPDIAEEDKW